MCAVGREGLAEQKGQSVMTESPVQRDQMPQHVSGHLHALDNTFTEGLTYATWGLPKDSLDKTAMLTKSHLLGLLEKSVLIT